MSRRPAAPPSMPRSDAGPGLLPGYSLQPGSVFLDARKLADFGIGSSLQTLLLGLARLQEERGLRLALKAGEPPPPWLEAFARVEARARNYSLAEHHELARLAHKSGAALYHAPHYVLPALLRLPAVVTIHDTIHLRFPQYLPGRTAALYARHMLRRAYRRAARIITVSQAAKVDLLQLLGGDPKRIVVVPNALHERFLEPVPAEVCLDLRRRYSLPERFLLYVGNIKAHKNLERLVRAHALAEERNQGALPPLVLAGATQEKCRPLHELAQALGHAQAVRSLGWLADADLRALYATAHACVFPSQIEGFGLPALEAMASGLPTLISTTPALREVCADAALAVDALDLDALAGGLLRIVHDTELRAHLNAAGPQRARAFPLAEQARATLAVWRSVLAGEC